MDDAVVQPTRGPNSKEYRHTARYRAMRRAVKSVADHALRCEDAVAAANEALASMRAEFVFRFDMIRSRQRQPTLIGPEPLPSQAGSR